MWFYFSLLSAILNSFSNIARRTHGSLAEPAELSWWALLIGTPFVFGLLLISKEPYYTSHAFILPMLATGIMNTLANVLHFKAYKYADASLVSPISNLLPLFMIPTSFIILGLTPSWIGLIGIILVVCGVYYTSVSGKHSLHHPLKNMFRNRGSRAMLLCVSIWSVGVVLEKISLRSASPAFLMICQGLVMLACLSVYLLFQVRGNRLKRGQKVMRRWGWHITAISIFSVLAVFFQFHAINLVDNPSYPMTVKKMDVLFTVLLAGLFLGEKHILKRFKGSLIALAGVALIFLAK